MTVFPSVGVAQSTEPDKPSPITGGLIEGEVSGNLNDDKTYYYVFYVQKGPFDLTVDIDPIKETGGGLIRWFYLDSKYNRIKWDQVSAQGNPERRVTSSTALSKQKVILKVVVGGNFRYKMKFSGSGFVH
ncbi:MAG: hypothetical protein KF760_23455 [Candidatus Eremiobacteraeota bacterium]|nr:hypothetical protein [Candidatus Eremiobacteraeota bacterium]MCW5866182.1 hypothetical protein [Candidatus Eremiobacteraeota bacterium]